MTLFDLVAKLTLDSSEYEQGLAGARGKLDTFANGVNSGLNNVLKVAGAAAGAAVAGMTAFAKSAVETGMGFDNAMSQVAATMGTTVDQIQQLRDFAQEMGATTKFTATEAAQALNYMALAGYDAEKSMSMLPTVLNLASAGAMDLARASDMVTDAESALGLTTEETVQLVNQMAKTASKSNTSVEQLGDAMLTIGGTAQFMAGGTDRLATVLGILADNGIKGSEAGTHLRNMLLKLSSPTEDGAKMIEALGLEIYDASGSMRDMQDIMLDLNAAMEGMTDQEKINIISELFNARDVAAVNALLNTSVERWNELGAAIKDSKGAADAMASTQISNLTGDITVMKSALDGVKIAFSDGITPAIRDVVQRITKALSNPKTSKFLKEVGQRLGELTKEIAHGIGNAIPKVIKWFDEWGDKLPIVGAALAGLVLAIKATVNPIGALVSGLALVAGGLAVAELAADDAAHKFSTLTDAQWEELDAAAAAADAVNDAKESRIDAMGAIDEETQKTRDLWGELQKLVDANGHVIDGNEERVDYILGELNNALGTEYSRNGDLIEQYGEMASAIDTLIEKRRAERLVAAAEESASVAESKLPEIQSGITDTQQAIADYTSALSDLESEHADIMAQINSTDDPGLLSVLTMKAQSVEKDIAATKEALGEAQGALTDWKNQEIDAYTEISNAEQAYVAMMEGDYDQVAAIFENDINNRMQHKVEAGNISQELVDEAKHNAEVALDAYQRYVDSAAQLGDAYSEEQAQKLFDTAQNAQAIYNDAVDALLQKQEEAGHEFVGGGGKFGEEAGEAFANGLSGSVDMIDTASNTMAETARKNLDITTKAEEIGLMLGQGFAKGIRDSAGEVQNAANYVAGIAANAMRTTLQIKSPSRVAMEIGEFFGEGFALGMEAKQESVIERAKELAKAARDSLDFYGTPGYDQDGNPIQPKTLQKSNVPDMQSRMDRILEALHGIGDNIGGNVVLDSGEIVGRIDGALGQISAQKARGLAWLG